jgi:hypothetical protein
MIDDLIKALGIITYRGCLIYPEKGKFRVYDQLVDTLDEAKIKIDDSFKWLQESIFNDRKNKPI